MQPYFIQIVFFVVGWYIFNRRNLGLRYYFLFSLPFYSTPLLRVALGDSVVVASQITLVGILLWMVVSSQEFSKKAMIKALIMLSPFLISILYNAFFFTPVYGWVIDGAARQESGLLSLQTSLTTTNFTQLIYIIFGAVVFTICSSLKMDRTKVKFAIEAALITVTAIGIVQVVFWYLGLNDIFRALFSTLGSKMADQTFLWNMKRISSTFPEPSYFGHYLFFTLSYYLHQYGYENFKSSKVVWAAVIIAFLSTSTTAYLGLCVITVTLYVLYSRPEEKMYYYVALLALSPILVYLLSDVVQTYINAKSTSTDQRFYVSWTLAWEGIANSPFFGYAYGTSRPLFIYTQMLHAVGIFGCLIFIFGTLIWNNKHSRTSAYLAGVVLVGIGQFEITRPEMWAYFGLLTNRYLAINNQHHTSSTATNTLLPQ